MKKKIEKNKSVGGVFRIEVFVYHYPITKAMSSK